MGVTFSNVNSSVVLLGYDSQPQPQTHFYLRQIVLQCLLRMPLLSRNCSVKKTLHEAL